MEILYNKYFNPRIINYSRIFSFFAEKWTRGQAPRPSKNTNRRYKKTTAPGCHSEPVEESVF